MSFRPQRKPLPFQQHPTSKQLHTPSRSAESGAFARHVDYLNCKRRQRMFYRLRKHFKHTPYPLLDATLAVLVVLTSVEMLVTLARLLD
jgi:hypothetical protein